MLSELIPILSSHYIHPIRWHRMVCTLPQTAIGVENLSIFWWGFPMDLSTSFSMFTLGEVQVPPPFSHTSINDNYWYNIYIYWLSYNVICIYIHIFTNTVHYTTSIPISIHHDFLVMIVMILLGNLRPTLHSSCWAQTSATNYHLWTGWKLRFFDIFWLVVLTILKHISQWEGLSHILYGK